MSGKVSVDERRRLVAASLQVGNPGNNARGLAEQSEPRAECHVELTIDEIRPYEHNPRRANNAKFDDIKESIRTSGLRSPLTVTRRPSEAHFIVDAGGNTRLLALQQGPSIAGNAIPSSLSARVASAALRSCSSTIRSSTVSAAISL